MLIREKGARLAVLPRSLITQVLTMAHQTGKWVKFTVEQLLYNSYKKDQ